MLFYFFYFIITISPYRIIAFIKMLYYLKKIDWPLAASALLLSLFGLLEIYSSSAGKGDFINFKKQIIFLLAGILFMFAVIFFDWRSIRDNPYLILIFYISCIILLLGLFLFGSKTRGVAAWYKFGSLSFDPIEPTKIILAFLLAKYFSMRHVEMYRLKNILISGLYVFIPAFLIFKQPNLGSALILIALWAGVLVISGIKTRHFIFLAVLAILVFSISWPFFLKDYQKERIASFLAPQSDPLGSNWNQTQAKIAIGSGGIFGQGFLNGSQTKYGFLPEPQTDFIFSAIAEEFGLLGVAILFLLFSIVIWRAMKISLEARSNFPIIFITGFMLILITQIMIHIGMNLGIFPVVGISLPLVSYGGSGLISMLIAVGIVESIKLH